MKIIYLAGGCFWGVQAYLKTLQGVVKTTVGYANSKIENPTYEQVKTGITEAVETVEVIFDETILSLNELLEDFLSVIDPRQLNYQGPDYGTQYRNGIYFKDPLDKNIINQVLAEVQEQYEEPVVTEVKEIKNYYLAETYHQDYFDKNSDASCHIKFK